MTKKNGFFICGLTGGPYFPIPAITQNLKQINPILIGVKNSFESKLTESNNLPIEFLPIAKLDILTFQSKDLLYILKLLYQSIKTIFLVIYSFFKSIQLLLKYQPAIVCSTGSFLAVPVIMATRFTNWLDWTNSLIVVHQQDPQPGLANKLTIKAADISSCVFEYTKQKFPKFKNCQVIPNPILSQNYNPTSNLKNRHLELFINRIDLNNEYHQNLHQTKAKEIPANLKILHAVTNLQTNSTNVIFETKPLFLIFGGGSGATQINIWVKNNFEILTQKFRIIHLTGTINSQTTNQQNLDYYQTEAIFEDMPKVLARVDVVLCRAGLGSISELLFIQSQSKQISFLVPLNGSHQELNAELVKDRFTILDNQNQDSWLEKIIQITESKKKNIQVAKINFDKDSLDKYYAKLNYEINRLY